MRRHAVAVRYVVAGNTYGFRVAAYDARRPLIIDPVLQAVNGNPNFPTSGN
jgi:hypothetical protein